MHTTRFTRNVLSAVALSFIAIPLTAQGGRASPPRTGAPQNPQAGQAQTAAQQQAHQQMMTQMQNTVQRAQQIQQRAQTLAQQLQQRTQDRTQLTERDRLMLGTCEALEQQARQMHQFAQRAEEMIRSREFQRDRDMQQDMDRLRLRLETMTKEMDESLKLMERVRDRTRTP
jgi:hypothetical protein